MCWLLLLAWVAFLFKLGSTGLVDETEPLFAEAARGMAVTGDWITPYFNGETRFDKPPLIYWLMAGGYGVFGVNEWAVRLPSANSAIALMVFCFFSLQKFTQSENPASIERKKWLSGWIGAAIAAFNLETLLWARQGVSDMLLSGCLGCALLCFFWGYAQAGESQKPRGGLRNNLLSFPNQWYLGFYVLSGLAVLTKGPVGIVLPSLIILAFLFYVGKFGEVLEEMKILWGLLIFALITIPWYVLVILANGRAYIDSFFGYHNVERFTSVVNGHDAPWYFYILVVLIGFFPWSIYLPLAMTRLGFWRRSFWLNKPRTAQLSLFAFFWFATIFIFFSIAVTKLPSYVLPLMPAAALLVAELWGEELTNTPRKNQGLLISGIAHVFFLVILAIAFILSPSFIGSDPAIENLPALVKNSGLPLRGTIIWLLTALAISWLLGQRKRWQWLILPNLVGFFIFLVCLVYPTMFFIDTARQLPLRELSLIIPQVQVSGEELWMIGFNKPSVVFYSQRPVNFFKVRNFLDDKSADLAYLKNLVTTQPFPDTLLILSRAKDMTKLGVSDEDYQILEQKGLYQLMRIPKARLLNRILNQLMVNG
ncbi:MAG: glycosyltransferase family 39 protein [Gomphosphaeria aponina SAG 52.96 = DSM 107014]|uniref:Glycosyltransferase family 39 protein n=1 Tax=Gomphosphaeria aponina SAG 52.96 = DSM 107014 TaxID=1521640 RepID=A0A941JLR7_9CHRO|nr:glycosyltransferase family 39 protein [Gomphosphaeria aponina SAG 52.96 = DSM 107014]